MSSWTTRAGSGSAATSACGARSSPPACPGVRTAVLWVLPAALGSPAPALLERLEATVEAASQLPFRLEVRVNEAVVFDLIGELRGAVVSELAPRSGQWLRRRRRIAESRAPLRAAWAMIDALGCGA
jgi:hypothetical protein